MTTTITKLLLAATILTTLTTTANADYADKKKLEKQTRDKLNSMSPKERAAAARRGECYLGKRKGCFKPLPKFDK